jgi:hypothetical protein
MPPSHDADASPERVAGFTSFATVGALGLTQDLTHAVLESIGDIEGADSELVAEETLCLVATATARAVEVGLEDEPEHQSVLVRTLLDLPFTYRDYLIGKAMVADDRRRWPTRSAVVSRASESFTRPICRRASFQGHTRSRTRWSCGWDE